MFALAALLSLITQVSGTPYIPGGDTPAGTDCSGLASWVANVASGRPAFGSRFNTGNMESALLARGFHYGSAPGSVVIGWNGGHAAVTLPDGTPVSSGESGTGVRVGGGGAYQPQFTRHMYLPVQAEEMHSPEPVVEPMADPPADPAAEPIVDPVAEPIVDPVAEPIVEPVAEAIVEPVAEAIVGPAPEPLLDPVPEPIVEPVAEPLADPAAEPVVEPLADPAAEPVVEPLAEPVADPAAEPVTDEVTD
ncbi:hypothetical protein MCEMAEM6B_00219 [Mycobacteriaceae bacterium]